MRGGGGEAFISAAFVPPHTNSTYLSPLTLYHNTTEHRCEEFR